MAFEIASTNLVIELGVILALLLGWQFTLAEFVGGPVMIITVAVMFRLFIRRRLIDAARKQADQGLAGSMEGHAGMDMSVSGSGSFFSRLFSANGFTAVSQVFVMEWAAILRDLVLGLLIAGAVGAWVPAQVWSGLFFTDHPTVTVFWGPLVAPLVAIFTFVCSVGNVPLAAVLWNGGISFGGVITFLLADLIILPILNIYRRYYGLRMAAVLLGVFYVAMVIAGYVVEGVFAILHLIPQARQATVLHEGISWDYTTVLNIAALTLAVVLIVRFLRSGGLPMLREMGGDPAAAHQ